MVVYKDYYTAPRKNRIVQFAATWKELDGVLPRGQKGRDGHRMISQVWDLKIHSRVAATKGQRQRMRGLIPTTELGAGSGGLWGRKVGNSGDGCGVGTMYFSFMLM